MKMKAIGFVISIAALVVSVINSIQMGMQGDFSEFFWISALMSLIFLQSVISDVYSFRTVPKLSGKVMDIVNIVCLAAEMALLIFGVVLPGRYKESAVLLFLTIIWTLIVLMWIILRVVSRRKE